MQPLTIRDYAGGVSVPGDEVSHLFGPASALHRASAAHVALVGTFAPRKCGIATFTSDVVEQLEAFHPELAIDVYALDRTGSELAYDRPKRIIRVDDAQSFASAARGINASGVDAVWIQHEFGIFGDRDGEAIGDFVDQIAAPLIFTFHTVLTAPSKRQRDIMDHLIERASKIMVMSQQGRDLLIDNYGAPPGIVDVIHHGAPDRPFGRGDLFKQGLGLADRNVLMTFGLLGPGKGLERVIEALPAIIARHPDTIYRIVGATHPNLLAEQGEAYREQLQELAIRYGVERHIAWEDRFLETPELLDQLEACDIYVTPYMNLQQSTSGTLSYAVALGKAVVSTRYVHARELLADGGGVLVEPDSHRALAAAIIDLLDNRAKRDAIQREAYARGRRTIWPEFAKAGAALVRSAIATRVASVSVAGAPGLRAVFDMSDHTGMLQHAIGPIPNRIHGYCLDDNARALILMNVAEGTSAPDLKSRSLVYASFVQHAWNDEAKRFRNFMRFDRSWCEDAGSEDSNGRALWALGQTIELSDDADLRWWALNWFDKVLPHLAGTESPRAAAFNLLGACSALRSLGGHAQAEALVASSADFLYRLLDTQRRPDWAWFEAVLGYDNPRMSQALIEAGELCGKRDWTDAGLETLRWIAEHQAAQNGRFRPVGSDSLGRPAMPLPFDQQPLEAQAAIEAAEVAYRATGARSWLDHAEAAYAWFFGANDRGVVLVDHASGQCRDGITPRGRNENCGAESILAFHLAYYSLHRMRSEKVGRSQPTLPLRHAAHFPGA